MRINCLYKGALVAVTLCVAPAALPASPKAGQPDAPAVAGNTGASPDVSSHLEQMRIDATSVENEVGQLQMLVRGGFLSSEVDAAGFVDNVRDQVNEMNELLYYLRVHQAEASPLQQKIIRQVAAPTLELAGATEGAIDTMNNNRTHLLMSDFPGLANAIYNEASRVDQTVGDLDKYVHARHEEQQLRQTLGLKNNS
jgi:hypothetical protein